jgi:hypothetical protein
VNSELDDGERMGVWKGEPSGRDESTWAIAWARRLNASQSSTAGVGRWGSTTGLPPLVCVAHSTSTCVAGADAAVIVGGCSVWGRGGCCGRAMAGMLGRTQGDRRRRETERRDDGVYGHSGWRGETGAV